ncbi:MAG TPA: hypothetical protein VGK78_15760 [Nocardioides sp.]|uniref:hypothetical protein n=1 Tax=Nocardioides sp. TaxID=35761 RepID=UPI002F40912F
MAENQQEPDQEAEQEPESERITRTDSGVEIFIEDAGGRELHDPAERPPEAEVREIEEERTRRLDAKNRPENAEVDNTHRVFDPEVGMFTDSNGYDARNRRYALDPKRGG